MGRTLTFGVVMALLVLGMGLSAHAQQADPFRPAYTGYNKLEVEKSGPREKIQGLEELASRWGVKPYAKLARGTLLQPARVIFRDVQTGAEIWRISDDPFSTETHRYADYSGWNCDGSLMTLKTPRWVGGRAVGLLMRGDAAGVRAPVPEVPSGLWDPTDPHRVYAMGKGGLRVANALTGDSELILPIERLHAIMEPQYLPDKPWVQLYGVSEDGKWVVGRAGGSQDEGRIAFLARTDGGELKVLEAPGGIHYGLVLRTTPLSICLSLRADPPMQVWNMKDGSWEKMPYNMSHRVWGPEGDRVAFSHGMTGPGGYWGLVTWSRKTREMTVMSQASNYNEGHQTWCHYDPDWVLATYQSPSAPGADLLKLKTDGSRTAFRICNTMMQWPQHTVYTNNAFGASSPDGTKVMFGGSTLGSKDTFVAIVKHPEPPRKVKATPAPDGKTTLTWDAPRNHRETAGYCVYHSPTSGGKRTRLTKTPVKELRFGVGTDGFYVVTSVEHSGLESVYSNEVCVSVTGQWVGAATVYVEAESGKLELPMREAFGPAVASDEHFVWQTKAEEPGSATLKVDLPRNGKYVVKARMSGNDAADPWSLAVDDANPVVVPAAVPTSQWQWVSMPGVFDLKKGEHTLTFSTKHFGAAIDSVLVTTDAAYQPAGLGTADETPPGKVDTLAVKEADTYDVTLTWESVPDADVHHYNVYRGTGGAVEAKQRCLVGSPDEAPFVDWGLKPETTYQYTVTVVDRRGNESARGNVVTAKTAPMARKRFLHTIDMGQSGGAVGVPRQTDGSVLLQGDAMKLDVPITVPVDDDYIIWCDGLVPQGSASTSFVRMDDARERRWMFYYDATRLGGGRQNTEWTWVPITPREYEAQGRFTLTAGDHKLTLRGGNVKIRKLVVTNDFSFVPKGRLNTLYLY